MKETQMTVETIDARLRAIDSRVARLESINDDWIASHGEMNQGTYELIQKLMDEREELVAKKYSL